MMIRVIRGQHSWNFLWSAPKATYHSQIINYFDQAISKLGIDIDDRFALGGGTISVDHTSVRLSGSSILYGACNVEDAAYMIKSQAEFANHYVDIIEFNKFSCNSDES